MLGILMEMVVNCNCVQKLLKDEAMKQDWMEQDWKNFSVQASGLQKKDTVLNNQKNFFKDWKVPNLLKLFKFFKPF